MPRNLNRRVEILFPVLDAGIRERLRDEILGTYLADNLKTRVLHADGTWEHVWPAAGEAAAERPGVVRRPARAKQRVSRRRAS